MKKLLAAVVGLAILAGTAHATNPTVHITADGPVLMNTTDVDTLHISLTGNTNHEHIGILWFIIAAPPQLKLYLNQPADRRYEPDVFWNVNPTDNTGPDSIMVDAYGRTVYEFTMNAYQPADSCLYRTANESGRIGRIHVRLKNNPGGAHNYSVSLGITFSPLPGTVFPPALPWTQLCYLQDGEFQPGIDTQNATVTISADVDGGGSCYCCTHYCDEVTAVRRATWGKLKAAYK